MAEGENESVFDSAGRTDTAAARGDTNETWGGGVRSHAAPRS